MLIVEFDMLFRGREV